AEAEEALAFDRAARLYKLALELRPVEGPEGSAVRAKLGDALAHAGRGPEAAAAYLEAAKRASGGQALHLRRRSAEELLRSGHIDEALAEFRIVLDAVGMELPKSPNRALVSLLLRRAQVRIRGLGFREREESQIQPEL